MKRRLSALPFALFLLAGPVPAEAAYVHACTTVDSWTFDPPLGAEVSVGLFVLETTLSCRQVDSDGGVSTNVYFVHSPGGYIGTCTAAALLANDFTGAIAGATASATFLVGVRSTASAHVFDAGGCTAEMSSTGVALDVFV